MNVHSLGSDGTDSWPLVSALASCLGMFVAIVLEDASAGGGHHLVRKHVIVAKSWFVVYTHSAQTGLPKDGYAMNEDIFLAPKRCLRFRLTSDVVLCSALGQFCAIQVGGLPGHFLTNTVALRLFAAAMTEMFCREILEGGDRTGRHAPRL